MIVYRLANRRYASDLSGKGAELYGGRWNSKGTAVIYTSASRALCVTELAVNLPLVITPLDYHLITIEVPDSYMYELDTKLYPEYWRSVPHLDATQKLGDKFITEAKYLTMKVESAVVQDEYNFLINPRHKSFSKVKIQKIEAFRFDSRLGK